MTISRFHTFLLAGVLVASLSPFAMAQDKKPAPSAAPAAPAVADAAKEAKMPKVIVVDVQKIMAESTAAKSIRSQVGEMRKSLEADVKAKENELRTAEQELMKEQGKLSQDDFAKKRQAFEQKFAASRKSIDERVSALDGAVNRASGEIERELQKSLFELAKAQGAGLVLPKQAILVAETSMDFTDTIMAEVNKKLPKVDVKLGAPAAPAAAPAKEKKK